MDRMNLTHEMFDFAPRIGDTLQLRRPPRFRPFSRRWHVTSSVRIMVTSLDPLHGAPVELVRTWRNGRGEFVIHSRKLAGLTTAFEAPKFPTREAAALVKRIV